MPCDGCRQTGFVKNKEKECKKCLGNGFTHNVNTKKIAVPKNFDYMTKMKLNNYGHYDPESELNADVLIAYQIKDAQNHNMEVFNQYDIILEHRVNIWDALSGYSMHYDHPDGKQYLFKVDDVIKHGDVKYIKNIGLPYTDNDSSGRGKLFIKFKYIYPDTVMDSEKLKAWFSNKDKHKDKHIGNYKKEKVHSVKEQEFEKLKHNQARHNNSQDTSDSEDERAGQGGQGGQGGRGGQECHVQ